MTGLFLRLARQWISGENARDAIKEVEEANSKRILGLINLLGEHVNSKAQVESTINEYGRLLDLIDQAGVKSHISIKPTQFGLNIDYEYCLENYLRTAKLCASHNENYLWIDMENSPYTQSTINLYSRVLSNYGHTGLAIQAYLKRSEQDIKHLLPLGAKIRLVKGAYNESSLISFKKKDEVRQNYERLLRILFEDSGPDNFFAIATHDDKLISRSKEISYEFPKAKFEYEMLMGVRDKLKLKLVSDGEQVREYIPYGPEWFAYSIRRIKEKKSNLLLLARSLFSG